MVEETDVMTNKFKIEFRYQQVYLNYDVNQPVIVQCNVDGTATYIPGLINPNPWVDMTDHTEGLEKFRLTWEAFTGDQAISTGTDQATANQFGSNYSKAVSAELGFYGIAFQFIFDWLMTNKCQILNAVEVRVTDMDCGKSFRIFEIKTDNIRYMPYEEPCKVTVPLREQDILFDSLGKTILEDDWQKWFNSDGTSTKDHPTFIYVVEKRPHFILAALLVIAYLAGILSGALLTTFDFYKRWIRQILGICYYCPSPLIRTYIENICTKYNYTFNTMFDDKPENPYRDVCLFYPVTKFQKNYDDYTAGNNIFFWDNRTGMAFSMFLDQLKKVFNAEWYITPNKQLVFQPKSYFDGQTPILDFTNPGAIRFFNFAYDFNGQKKAAYGDYEYKIDPIDSASNDLKWRYSEIVDFDGASLDTNGQPAFNPMLEGNITKMFDFASTGFIFDGDTEDFLQINIDLAAQIAAVGIIAFITAAFISLNPITGVALAAAMTVGYLFTDGFINNFYGSNTDIKNAVRTVSNVVNVPRLLLWDSNTPMDDAKVVTAIDPAQVPYYNVENKDYYNVHLPFDAPAGYFGTTVTEIANYPMFVDAKFAGNLYDRFQEYDNPLKNPQTNQTFEADIDLCCESADLFGFYEDQYAKIGAVVILENRNGKLIKARLTYIEPDYDKGVIHLKGTVLQ